SNSGSTGKHYAIRVAGTGPSPSGLTSNYNVLLANGSGGFVGLFNAIDRLGIADWRTATAHDANSQNSDPQFIDATGTTPNLHINAAVPSCAEAMGTNVASVTNDYDNETRSGLTPVDIGADAGNFTPLPNCSGTPPAGTISGTSAICSGSPGVTLSFANGSTDLGFGYQWASSTTSGSGYSNLGTATTQATGAITQTTYYIVTTTCSFGGATNVSPEFTVTVNPTPTATAGSNSPVCVGQTLNLTGTTNIGTTFSWAGPNSYTSTSQSPSITGVTAAAAGVYTFTATASGCTSAASTTTVVVNPNPTAVTVTPPAPTICAGSSIQLTASGGQSASTIVSGAGATTTVATTTASTLGPNPMQSFYGNTKTQMMWTVAELNALGFSSGSTITSIAINMATAESRNLLNYIVKVQQTAAVTGLASTVTTGWTTVFGPQTITPVVGYNTFTFSTPLVWNGTTNILVEMNHHNDDSGGSGTSTARYDTGLSYTASNFFRVDGSTPGIDTYSGAPTNTYTARNQVRFGTLANNAFTWAASPELNTTIGATVTATPAATNTYTVSATNGVGCTSSASVTVTIGAGTPPTASIAAGGPTTFCAGGSVALTSTITNGCIPYTYSWSNGVTTVATTANYTATASGNY
ncbi:MAG TPA: hypothetical protein VHL57_09935, partial [Flavobacteriales bacterium]|nr:hypothetical protein [Flavobacteriales bacterium]